MAVVFRFESVDSRQRAVLSVADIPSAVAHIGGNFVLKNFSFDEDGDDPACLPRIVAHLEAGEPVRLYEHDTITDDLVDIIPA